MYVQEAALAIRGQHTFVDLEGCIRNQVSTPMSGSGRGREAALAVMGQHPCIGSQDCTPVCRVEGAALAVKAQYPCVGPGGWLHRQSWVSTPALAAKTAPLCAGLRGLHWQSRLIIPVWVQGAGCIGSHGSVPLHWQPRLHRCAGLRGLHWQSRLSIPVWV